MAIKSYAIKGKASRVPSEYDEVEYCYMPLSAYINLGIPYNSGMTIEIKESHGSSSSSVIGANPYFAITNTSSTRRVRYNNTVFDGTAVGTAVVVKLEKNVLYIDGVLKKTFTASSFSSVYNMLLGGRMSQSGVPEETAICTVYYLKISIDNTPVFDMIPVKKKSNNEYGMYDLVSKSFFGNDGASDFRGGSIVPTTVKTYAILDKSSRVPTEYQEIEYIATTTKSEYINTNILMKASHKIECYFSLEAEYMED